MMAVANIDAPVGPVPRLLRFFFTDPVLSAKYPKGLAVPLGINRVHVATTLRSLCSGNSAGTCYGNVTEASKSDVLGVDLEAVLEYLEDDTWVGKNGMSGGKMLRSHGFVVVDVSSPHLLPLLSASPLPDTCIPRLCCDALMRTMRSTNRGIFGRCRASSTSSSSTMHPLAVPDSKGHWRCRPLPLTQPEANKESGGRTKQRTPLSQASR